MTKRFCDICEKLAGHKYMEWKENFGEPYKLGSGELISSHRCLIVARVVYSFQDHPTGFGGPPDLCQDCASRLVREIVNVGER